jgi:hypothetical protein
MVAISIQPPSHLPDATLHHETLALLLAAVHLAAVHPLTPLHRDWKRAPNFVAKRYKKPVARDVYFADVVLQVGSCV